MTITTNSKNPRMIVVYRVNGKQKVKNPDYDPSKCEWCGKKHGFFQAKCKPIDGTVGK